MLRRFRPVLAGQRRIVTIAALIACVSAGPAEVSAASTQGAVPAHARLNANGVNLIKNGRFAAPNCAPVYCEFDTGSRAIPHWRVGGNSVDLVSGDFWQPAPGCQQSVDLSGSAPGSLTETVATVAGRTYVLSWYLSGNPQGGQPVKTMHVYWDGKLVDSVRFNTTNHTTTSMGWVRRHVTVTATSSTSSVRFADATPDKSPYGATLDRVTLVQKN